MHDYTATGYTLGSRLTVFAEAANAGHIPAEYGRKITAALDKIEEQRRQHDAYRALANLIDPDSLTPWATAERIHAALCEFEVTPAYRRIRCGYREAEATEKWLVEALPLKSVKSIYNALVSAI